eukprot:jgi/Mesvir1/12495/Mv08107-RA.1
MNSVYLTAVAIMTVPQAGIFKPCYRTERRTTPVLPSACRPHGVSLGYYLAPTANPSAPLLRTRRRQQVSCEFEDSPKMYVPPDAFGGRSPESKMASVMKRFFTWTAVHIVLAQLQNVAPKLNLPETGAAENSLDAVNTSNRIVSDYDLLWDHLGKEPMLDGDEWIKSLMARNRLLAVRIMEVREAYARMDFEWDNVEKLAKADLAESNARLMTSWFVQTMDTSKAAESEGNNSSNNEGGDAKAT